MATDIVLVARPIEEQLRTALHEKIQQKASFVTDVVDAKSRTRVDALLKNAEDQGAFIKNAKVSGRSPSIIEDITPDMNFWTMESFGPLLGLRVFDDEKDAIEMMNGSQYGLSGAIFSRNHLHALHLAKQLQTGAVHVNSSTVHDEACLPHGGRKDSGWGRFGSTWAFDEFLQTKTVIMHR